MAPHASDLLSTGVAAFCVDDRAIAVGGGPTGYVQKVELYTP
jgi:hypothetical protein